MRASLWARRYSCGVSISNIGQLILLLRDRKSTRLNSSHLVISYAVFCLKKKKNQHADSPRRTDRPLQSLTGTSEHGAPRLARPSTTTALTTASSTPVIRFLAIVAHPCD